MKKILVVLNGTLTPPHVTGTAIRIAAATSSFLHAAFVNDSIDLAEYNYPFPNDLSLTRNNLTGKTIAEETEEILADNIRLFEDECRAAKVDFYIEPGKEMLLGKLIEYSAFSDFILADANANLNQYHIADLLVSAHCPVYLVSKDIGNVENIILTYDGHNSSMYAIKMFSYLMPELQNLPVFLVHIAPDKTDELPQKNNIESWLSRHQSNIRVKILQGNVRDELINYTKYLPNSLVVMGSFGRSAMSRFFHRSLANAVIEEGKASLFITHE